MLALGSDSNRPPSAGPDSGLDPLRDEGRLYAERLAVAGVPVRHTNYLGAPHGFASSPGATTIGRQHRAESSGGSVATCARPGARMSRPDIRPAEPADLAGVAAIYAHFVGTSTATFDVEEPAPSYWQAKLDSTAVGDRFLRRVR